MKTNMNNGKTFERLSYIIENALNKDNNSRIYHNHKIVDNNGNLRQFDVFITSEVNGYEICIAIECKDYKSNKISIDKIDSFVNKCKHLPSINKLIYVTNIGYQKGSIKQAEIEGVELYTIEDITKENIIEWKSRPKLQTYSINSKLLYTKSHVIKDLSKKNDVNIEIDWNSIVYRKSRPIFTLQKLYEQIYYENKKAYEETIFQKINIQNISDYPHNITLPIICNQKYYIKDSKGKICNSKCIIVMIEIIINKNKYDLLYSNVYKELKSEYPKCNIHCVQSDKNDIHFVVENSDLSIFELFYQDENNNLKKLNIKYKGKLN